MCKVCNFGQNLVFGCFGQLVELVLVYVLLVSFEVSFIIGEVYGVIGGVGIV